MIDIETAQWRVQYVTSLFGQNFNIHVLFSCEYSNKYALHLFVMLPCQGTCVNRSGRHLIRIKSKTGNGFLMSLRSKPHAGSVPSTVAQHLRV